VIVNAQNDTVLAKTPVRIGLVGCGRLAEFGYIPAFRRAAGVALAGLADVNPTRCTDLAPQVPAYKTVQDLIEGGGVDAIIVSTPTRYHLADAMAAAQAKLPALVEKPPGIDVREAEALARLLPRPWIAFNRRFDPDLARLQRQIGSEETLTVHLELHYRRNAWNPIDMQDDALLDLGPHLVDLARWLTACEVTSVHTRTLKPDCAEFELELERARATITCCCNRPYRERVDAWGMDGRPLGTYKRGGIVAGVVGKLLPGRENPLVQSLARQLELFSYAVRGVPSTQQLASVGDGVKAMTILEAVRRSARSGGSKHLVIYPHID